MVRRPRVEIEGGLYHVYNRVASGEPIFADPNETVEFIETIGETKRRDGWTVLAWFEASRRAYLGEIRAGIDPEQDEGRLSWHPLTSSEDESLDIGTGSPKVDFLGRSTDLERSTLEAERFVGLACELLGVLRPGTDMAPIREEWPLG